MLLNFIGFLLNSPYLHSPKAVPPASELNNLKIVGLVNGVNGKNCIIIAVLLTEKPFIGTEITMQKKPNT